MIYIYIYELFGLRALRAPRVSRFRYFFLPGIRTMFADADACFAGWLHYCAAWLEMEIPWCQQPQKR